MHMLAVGVIALLAGAFGGAQLDDAVEVATGEKDSFPILQIILILAVLAIIYTGMRRLAK